MSTERSSEPREPDQPSSQPQESGQPKSAKVEVLDADSAREIVIGWTPDSSIKSDYALRHWHGSKRWMSSDEGKAAFHNYVRLLWAAAAAFIVFLYGGFAALIFKAGWATSLLIILAGMLICCSCLIIGKYKYHSAREFYTPSDLDHAHKGEVNARWLRDLDLQNLIQINRQQMKVYQEIATKHAKLASRSCQIAISCGFLILVAGAIIALEVATDPAAKIVVGSLAVIGSAVTTFISKTFFEAQKLAMSQLNLYYRQPLVTSYLLQAERLTNRLEKASQREKITSVVDRMLAAARNAYEGGQGEPLRIAEGNHAQQGAGRPDGEAAEQTPPTSTG